MLEKQDTRIRLSASTRCAEDGQKLEQYRSEIKRTCAGIERPAAELHRVSLVEGPSAATEVGIQSGHEFRSQLLILPGTLAPAGFLDGWTLRLLALSVFLSMLSFCNRKAS